MSMLDNIKMEAEALVRCSSQDRMLTSPTISSSANFDKTLIKGEKSNCDIGQEMNNGFNNNLTTHKSGGSKGGLMISGNDSRQTNGSGNAGALPSFSDILWCTDVDGDVMTSPLDSHMVITRKLCILNLLNHYILNIFAVFTERSKVYTTFHF